MSDHSFKSTTQSFILLSPTEYNRIRPIIFLSLHSFNCLCISTWNLSFITFLDDGLTLNDVTMFVQSTFALMALVASGAAMPFNKRTENQVVSGSLATDQVTNSDGGAATDSYTFFQGDGSTGQGWPDKSQWASFDALYACLLFTTSPKNYSGS